MREIASCSAAFYPKYLLRAICTGVRVTGTEIAPRKAEAASQRRNWLMQMEPVEFSIVVVVGGGVGSLKNVLSHYPARSFVRLSRGVIKGLFAKG